MWNPAVGQTLCCQAVKPAEMFFFLHSFEIYIYVKVAMQECAEMLQHNNKLATSWAILKPRESLDGKVEKKKHYH